MKSWKTSLAGALGAAWMVAQPIITNGNFDLKRDWKNVVGAAIIAIFGFLVKDFNTTGGTVSNGQTPQ